MTFEDKLIIFPDLEQKLNDFGLVFLAWLCKLHLKCPQGHFRKVLCSNEVQIHSFFTTLSTTGRLARNFRPS